MKIIIKIKPYTTSLIFYHNPILKKNTFVKKLFKPDYKNSAYEYP